ncbi:hypothetical protein [Streptomyces sp. NPDC054837]
MHEHVVPVASGMHQQHGDPEGATEPGGGEVRPGDRQRGVRGLDLRPGASMPYAFTRWPATSCVPKGRTARA